MYRTNREPKTSLTQSLSPNASIREQANKTANGFAIFAQLPWAAVQIVRRSLELAAAAATEGDSDHWWTMLASHI